MKSGDLVRFIHPTGSEWKFGLLIEYHKWEKIATILSDAGLIRVAARHVQKFGKRYLVVKEK
jgi:hypothetical protein|tara:strand:- start:679 stop:864 length:186 start_codon:yes stop_codon:yes gene_type:complete